MSTRNLKSHLERYKKMLEEFSMTKSRLQHRYEELQQTADAYQVHNSPVKLVYIYELCVPHASKNNSFRKACSVIVCINTESTKHDGYR